MTREEILASSAMPLASPSYPKGPYRFVDREFLIIHYESDSDAIREMLPEPDGNHVFFEWMKMPDSTGFGSYQESPCGIAARFNGIWGYPKKIGVPT